MRRIDDRGNLLLYVDRQVLNEYTSPQAFSALRDAGRRVWRPEGSLAVVDHVNPTTPVRTLMIADAAKAKQVSYLGDNSREFGIELFDVLDKRQGIEHVVATEQGFVLPGMVIAAGDSHTITHVRRNERRRPFDRVQHECGGRCARRADPPDDKVVAYLRDKPRTPRGALFDQAVESWKALASDAGAAFEREVVLDAMHIEPMVTWGTSPDQAAPIGASVPDPAEEPDALRRRGIERALDYMALAPGMRLDQIRIDRAFIGSCTNGRIEDLRDAARSARGRRVAAGVRAMIVPGSTAVHDHGVPAILLPAGDVATLMTRASDPAQCVLTVDLPAQTIVSQATGERVGFSFDPNHKDMLVRGLSAVDATLEHAGTIRSFEHGYYRVNPWLA